MVKRVSKAGRLAGLVRKYNYPVSIKLRLGTNEYEKHHKVYLNCINSVDADFFVVHAKTGSQNSDEEADYSIFQECIEAAKKRNIPLIANGGIDSKEKVALLKGMGAGGVMIGRPAIKNPAIFDYLKGNKTPEIPEIKKEYFELLERFNSPGKYKTNLINYWKKH
jgi:tRNA-dihydrouridine synthase